MYVPNGKIRIYIYLLVIKHGLLENFPIIRYQRIKSPTLFDFPIKTPFVEDFPLRIARFDDPGIHSFLRRQFLLPALQGQRGSLWDPSDPYTQESYLGARTWPCYPWSLQWAQDGYSTFRNLNLWKNPLRFPMMQWCISALWISLDYLG